MLSFTFQLNARISRLTAHRRSTQQVTVHRRSPRRWLHLVEAGFHRGTAFTPYPLSSVPTFDSRRHVPAFKITLPIQQRLGSNHRTQYTCDAITTEPRRVIVPVPASAPFNSLTIHRRSTRWAIVRRSFPGTWGCPLTAQRPVVGRAGRDMHTIISGCRPSLAPQDCGDSYRQGEREGA